MTLMRPLLESSGLEVMAAGSDEVLDASAQWCQCAVAAIFQGSRGGRGIGRGRLATKRRARSAPKQNLAMSMPEIEIKTLKVSDFARFNLKR